MRILKLLLATALLAACVDDDATSPISAGSTPKTNAMVTRDPAPPPIITVPSGYGNYCSVTYSSGGWAFATSPSHISDPCGDILRSSPGGTIQRAGLWSVNGDNNVLVRCGDVGVLRGTGSAPITQAYNNSAGKKNCIFTIAPTELRIFSRPYGFTNPYQANPDADVTVGRGFDYNVYRYGISVTEFGQTPDPTHPLAHSIDREGKQKDRNGTFEECTTQGMSWPCDIIPGEPAYDWGMPAGKPITAVAAGIVRGVRWRDVSMFTNCGTDKQAEIYIEHKVGSGQYAERFVTYYAHMSKMTALPGQIVSAGTKIGEAGNTGCSFGDHLHFGVHRLTNLSGRRDYTFQLTPSDYGVNGLQGIIDPFGWAAPAGIDPWAYRFLNDTSDTLSLPEPGAFSIYLWKLNQRPPWKW